MKISENLKTWIIALFVFFLIALPTIYFDTKRHDNTVKLEYEKVMQINQLQHENDSLLLYIESDRISDSIILDGLENCTILNFQINHELYLCRRLKEDTIRYYYINNKMVNKKKFDSSIKIGFGIKAYQ